MKSLMCLMFLPARSAVFSDGSFCYIPKGTTCPMEISTYFRINNKDLNSQKSKKNIFKSGCPESSRNCVNAHETSS